MTYGVMAYALAMLYLITHPSIVGGTITGKLWVEMSEVNIPPAQTGDKIAATAIIAILSFVLLPMAYYYAEALIKFTSTAPPATLVLIWLANTTATALTIIFSVRFSAIKVVTDNRDRLTFDQLWESATLSAGDMTAFILTAAAMIVPGSFLAIPPLMLLRLRGSLREKTTRTKSEPLGKALTKALTGSKK